MAHNADGGLGHAQLAALLAAATGRAPVGHIPAGQEIQAGAAGQANPLAQLMQTLHDQQALALAQLLQPQPVPQPQPQQPAKDTPVDKELEYRNARSAQLDKTLVLFLRAAESSNMTRFAILEDMNGRHGHSSVWWKNYYLTFADDIDLLVKADAAGVDSDSRPSISRGKSSSFSRAGALKPVLFPGPSPTRKRKAQHSPSPSPEGSDAVDIVPYEHAPSPRKVARPMSKATRLSRPEDIPDSELDEPLDDAPGPSVERKYNITIPARLPQRAPSPPTNIVSLVPGRTIFTDEDIAYFVDMVLWQAKTVAGASKKTILAAISTQAPHHSFASWDTFYGRAKGREVLSEGLRMAAVEAAAAAN